MRAGHSVCFCHEAMEGHSFMLPVSGKRRQMDAEG